MSGSVPETCVPENRRVFNIVEANQLGDIVPLIPEAGKLANFSCIGAGGSVPLICGLHDNSKQVQLSSSARSCGSEPLIKLVIMPTLLNIPEDPQLAGRVPEKVLSA